VRLHLVDINIIDVYIRFIKGVALPESRKAPAWLEALDDEDLQFLRRFLVSSGSLKALAEEYGVSYPTVRGRLDRLIAKAEAAGDPKITDPFERKLRVLVADARMPAALAKELLEAHRSAGGRRREP
jgi:Domain of unknown function (DUF2089)-HTH